MKQYELQRDYEHPSGNIRKGVIKTDLEWMTVFNMPDDKDLAIKKDWFKEVESDFGLLMNPLMNQAFKAIERGYESISKANELRKKAQELLKSKEEVLPDWEILKCNKNGDIHAFRDRGELDRISNCIDDKCDIFSVRRKSDSEVLSVGQTVVRNDYTDVIDGFEIDGNNMKVKFCNGETCALVNLSDISKAPERKVLLNDFNDNPIYEGDVYWTVRKYEGGHTSQWVIDNKSVLLPNYDLFYFFRNKDDAIQFVLLNQPCLSVKDATRMYVGSNAWYFEQSITQLAKQKLKL